jgi:hypothetical protein
VSVEPGLELVGSIEAARERARGYAVSSGSGRSGTAPTATAGRAPGAGGIEGALRRGDVPACAAGRVLRRAGADGSAGDRLLDQVNDGQARHLFATALAVNEEPSPLPF